MSAAAAAVVGSLLAASCTIYSIMYSTYVMCIQIYRIVTVVIIDLISSIFCPERHNLYKTDACSCVRSADRNNVTFVKNTEKSAIRAPFFFFFSKQYFARAYVSAHCLLIACDGLEITRRYNARYDCTSSYYNIFTDARTRSAIDDETHCMATS